MDMNQFKPAPVRLSYSKDFLISFASLNCCQNWPQDIDPIVRRYLAADETPRKVSRGKQNQRKPKRKHPSCLNSVRLESVNLSHASASFEERILQPEETQENRSSLFADKDKRTITDDSARQRTEEAAQLNQGNNKDLLGALFFSEQRFVLPMPSAPTLQDIEKDIIASSMVEDKFGSSEQVGGLASKQELSSSETSKLFMALLQKRFSESLEENKEMVVFEKSSSLDAPQAKKDVASSRAYSSATVDSLRTSVSREEKSHLRRTHLSLPLGQQQKSWHGMPALIHQPHSLEGGILRRQLPLAFPSPAEAPLVPQALQALQRLVDHQLDILNSIPGEVTPGMLHQRLSMSVYGGNLYNQLVPPPWLNFHHGTLN